MCSVVRSKTAIYISTSLLCDVLCEKLIHVHISHHIPQHMQVMLSNYRGVGKSKTCADYSVVGNIV